jgi:hypothetical protein
MMRAMKKIQKITALHKTVTLTAMIVVDVTVATVTVDAIAETANVATAKSASQ